MDIITVQVEIPRNSIYFLGKCIKYIWDNYNDLNFKNIENIIEINDNLSLDNELLNYKIYELLEQINDLNNENEQLRDNLRDYLSPIIKEKFIDPYLDEDDE
ncbi:hypothetical protein [Sangeribacter muris]|uniref:hypothetical protein n=1 Tax=Sangeribacter muris TaxID=2880703 RepID=UPI00244E55B9|nr:hypothetical protein [Sangeribacter muris]